ncbi:esterase [Leifsonia sp. F6_8S_P_1B]|uniref:Esterase n=1 Tax=Leifsonia williamsii TaxID=3035919 RepID=A0ABT8K6Z6_9MICO|nr:alpha/beta fold hydrolase [Leifsonia williamsii]MDN4613230.1 esterase [Leifsonia williamsii]
MAVLLILHGRYGVAGDLPQVAEAVPPGWRVEALQAPLPLGDRFEWFHVEDWSKPGPLSADVAPAADLVLDWIEREAPGERVGIVGYSQGAATGLQALRRAPERIAFVVVLAGFMSIDAEAGDAELGRLRPPVLWVRGDQDDAITEADVQRLAAFLPAHSTLTERVLPGVGHEVPASMVAEVAAFLSRSPGEQPAAS